MRHIARKMAAMEDRLVWFGGDFTTGMYFWTGGLTYDTISTFQSNLLLSLSTFPIFVPGTYFKVKLNLNRYKAQQACLQFNFYTFMKYSKFL